MTVRRQRKLKLTPMRPPWWKRLVEEAIAAFLFFFLLYEHTACVLTKYILWWAVNGELASKHSNCILEMSTTNRCWWHHLEPAPDQLWSGGGASISSFWLGHEQGPAVNFDVSPISLHQITTPPPTKKNSWTYIREIRTAETDRKYHLEKLSEIIEGDGCDYYWCHQSSQYIHLRDEEKKKRPFFNVTPIRRPVSAVWRKLWRSNGRVKRPKPLWSEHRWITSCSTVTFIVFVVQVIAKKKKNFSVFLRISQKRQRCYKMFS